MGDKKIKTHKRTVILSTNDHPDYIACLPYVQKAWNKIGWNTLTFYLGNQDLESTDLNSIIKIEAIDGYRDATVVQVSRLFGAKHATGLIMTSDVDMMPLSNYWNPKEDCWTVYGEDLTNYKHYPICYIAAAHNLWNEIIYEQSIKELLEKYNQSKSESFDEWWYADQDIITERLRPLNPTSIPRDSIGLGVAKGRIDRIAWNKTLQIEGEKIDAHLPRPFNISETKFLLNKYLS